MRAESNAAKTAGSDDNTQTQDMQRLRDLLLGKDYQSLLELRRQLNTPELHSQKVAAVVSEAIHLRTHQDESLADALSPTIENALTRSIEKDPQRLANALYPVMGPAIRKSIHEVLAQTLETFNQLLEQSLSPRFLSWRFDAWRTGRSYSEVVLLKTLEYQVEQVFLIHSETGLLLRHAEAPHAISKDPDMISGMLTAIQDFIADSFTLQDGSSLNELRLGELTVLIDQGPYAAIAAVVRGNPPGDLAGLLDETQEKIHQQMGNTLLNYKGDNEPFVRIHPLLEACLITQRQQCRKRPPWLTYFLLAGLLSLAAYWGYQHYQGKHEALRLAEQQQQAEQQRLAQLEQAEQQQRRLWQSRIDQMNAEPGVVVVGSERTDNGYRVWGLLDPLARHPQSFVEPVMQPAQTEGQVQPARLEFAFQSYISAEPEMVLRHAQQVLQPPRSVRLAMQDGIFKVSGVAEQHWRDRLGAYWLSIPGVRSLDDSQLKISIPQPSPDLINRLMQTIEKERYLFDIAELTVDKFSEIFVRQAENIKQLIQLAATKNRNVTVTITGNTDNSGALQLNAALAAKRAENARNALINLGVPEAVLVVGDPAGSVLDERSVSYSVRLD
jgi:OOP family OmpA-OmpF porin